MTRTKKTVLSVQKTVKTKRTVIATASTKKKKISSNHVQVSDATEFQNVPFISNPNAYEEDVNMDFANISLDDPFTLNATDEMDTKWA